MKTVSGKLLSRQPASLSQAAKTIAAFVAADNGGAFQAVAAYLKRTSAAFNELVLFQKDHKHPNFNIKKHRPVDKVNSDQVRVESLENDGGKKKKKQCPENVEGDGARKKKEGIEGVARGSDGNLCDKENVVEGEGDWKVGDDDFECMKDKIEKKSEDGERGIDDQLRTKKKRKMEEITECEICNSSEQSGHKKKKRRRVEGDY